MAKHTLVCYWLISPALATSLSWMFGFGYTGLWLGIVAGEAYLCIVLMQKISNEDWNQKAKKD